MSATGAKPQRLTARLLRFRRRAGRRHRGSAGLAARCGDPVQAALWGVSVHALRGRALETSVGSLGFLAREIPGPVPGILDRLRPRSA
jgi:hypothetical protein